MIRSAIARLPGRPFGMRALLATLLPLALAGCLDAPDGAMALQAGRSNVLETALLDEGTIVVTGPAGYCIDGKSLRNRGERQFALVAQCDLLRSNEVTGVTSLAFLTVTAVRAPDDTPLPSAQQIAETFGPAEVLYEAKIDGIQVVQLASGGESATKQADPVHWRGVMTIKGHAIGLAAYSMQDGSGAGLEGRNLLLALGRRIRDASE